NPTASAVPLFNTNGTWRLNGDVTFTFPTNISVGAGQFLLLVNFNPATNLTQLNGFRALYGASNTPMFGPYSNGKLPNSSARLAIEKPMTSNAWVIVDEVIYADQFPW